MQRCVNEGDSYLTDGCLSTGAEEIMVSMAHEDFISCRLGMQDAMFMFKEDIDSREGLSFVEAPNLKSELVDMVDEETLRMYQLYHSLNLLEVARHFSEKSCKGINDMYYFGHGEDAGCSF